MIEVLCIWVIFVLIYLLARWADRKHDAKVTRWAAIYGVIRLNGESNHQLQVRVRNKLNISTHGGGPYRDGGRR